MDPAAQLRLALDPSEILRAQGMHPDPWQQQFLLAEDRCIMLCCSRGAGIPAGIAAVRSRLDTGRLKVWAQGCPNLISESELHHYPTKEEQQQGARAEIPIDADNHALGALRYLI